jgi:excisionase family DNA binding protein
MATTTTYTVTVAANVKDAITAANVSELALSENAHIARTTLRRRLSGQSPFTVSELQAIATRQPRTRGMTEKLTLTLREVAELTGLSLAEVERAVRAGELRARQVSSSTRLNRRVLRADIDKWLDSLPDAS